MYRNSFRYIWDKNALHFRTNDTYFKNALTGLKGDDSSARTAGPSIPLSNQISIALGEGKWYELIRIAMKQRRADTPARGKP